MNTKLPLRWVAALVCAVSPIRADVYIDLKNGTIYDIPTSGVPTGGTTTLTTAYAKVTLQKSANCTTTPWEAHVEMNLNPINTNIPPAKRVSLTVEYEADPTGWTTHIGDDTNNDGYGGGTGLKGVAEIQVVGDLLSVYSVGLSAGVVDKILSSKMRLHEGALHMNVMDQYFSYGNPATVLESKYLKQLFTLTDPNGDQRIFAGFNRVIRDGSPRKGCGAKKVLLGFEQ
jgi:hypothetical protein